MNIRVVGMLLMDDRSMPMCVHMWFLPVPRKIMLMLMMLIMTMSMRVFHRLMGMLVLVPHLKWVERLACRDPEVARSCMTPTRLTR